MFGYEGIVTTTSTRYRIEEREGELGRRFGRQQRSLLWPIGEQDVGVVERLRVARRGNRGSVVRRDQLVQMMECGVEIVRPEERLLVGVQRALDRAWHSRQKRVRHDEMQRRKRALGEARPSKVEPGAHVVPMIRDEQRDGVLQGWFRVDVL